MHYQPLDVSRLHPITPVLLRHGTRRLKPDVYRTHMDGQPVVIKDYSRYYRTLLAPIARLMVHHEAGMLRQLQGRNRHGPRVHCGCERAVRAHLTAARCGLFAALKTLSTVCDAICCADLAGLI
ncbi:hypothetical protein BXOR1_01430 [Xanthomonas oryzae pv. oryzicola]|nr:hypothetical protein BE73_02220 [Xanthomonas oryzae pv. oryzicola]KOR46521.1 hypothetical protein ADT27_10145 [Xanthomonas oryzae]AKK65551.1 hypothetical protein FE36_17995 [Xanthomonas oryzae pv. oryzicola]AKN99476.1 hypothetical protein ACU15_01890 [Xanthomonas oryzae pv. oryzicola]AKO06106.1 hypothetical protein ACU16_20465 [Xanthomonas oryzae pv. oryzicola]